MSQPKNRREGQNASFYHWKDDEPYPSVTSIIGCLNKPALPRWAAKATAEWAVKNLPEITAMAAKDKAAAIDTLKGAPWRERDAAATLGSLIHDVAEARTLDLPEPKVPDEHAGFVRSFQRFLDDWQPIFLASECEVYNRRDKYAGSLDFVATLPGLGLVVGDYKTGKPARGTYLYPEVSLQLTGYAHAEFIGMPDGTEVPMPKVDGCVGVALRPEGYKVIPFEHSLEVHRTFLYLRQVFEFTRNGGDWIGAPLAPPGKAPPVFEEV